MTKTETDKPEPRAVKPGRPLEPVVPQLSPRDEAAPGTPGTGENIDPRTGEVYTAGIGGA